MNKIPRFARNDREGDIRNEKGGDIRNSKGGGVRNDDCLITFLINLFITIEY